MPADKYGYSSTSPKTSEDMEALTSEARRICQCFGCRGGYAVGARTIAARAPGDMSPPPRPRERPTTCLAGVLLEAMLRVETPDG